jgi:hypothetical protein
MNSTQPKYIFKNGVCVLNEKHQNTNAYLQNHHTIPIAVVCTQDDLVKADAAYQESDEYKEKHIPLKVPDNTIHAIEQFHDEKFLNEYKTITPINGDAILDILCEQFTDYKLPIGLLPKLLQLKDYELYFIIDDSGSMNEKTDSNRNVACNFMKLKWRGNVNQAMTRWEEAEDRLHVMMDILAFLPIVKITISFLNRADVLVFERNGASPSELASFMHREINETFIVPPTHGTPIYGKLKEAFEKSFNPTMFYLFTDGEPSDGPVSNVIKLVLNRKRKDHLKDFPITFVSCTNDDKQTEWMKNIDEMGPYIAEVDDFEDEGNEVMRKQGEFFPYTRGIWLCCLLVGAINPTDLDALDESLPLTKYTLENIMGREITKSEYKSYWNGHKHAKSRYYRSYNKFLYQQTCSRDIIERDYPVQSWLKKKWNRFMIMM